MGSDEFEFHQMRGAKILSYARGQEDVKSELRHHGDLVVNAAADLITEMLRSKDFTLTIKAEKQRKLYSVNANLSKFPREYGVCTMHWRESAAEQQANR